MLQLYSNPRIICEFLTDSQRVRGGLGWGKNLRLLQGLLYNSFNCGDRILAKLLNS